MSELVADALFGLVCIGAGFVRILMAGLVDDALDAWSTSRQKKRGRASPQAGRTTHRR